MDCFRERLTKRLIAYCHLCYYVLEPLLLHDVVTSDTHGLPFLSLLHFSSLPYILCYPSINGIFIMTIKVVRIGTRSCLGPLCRVYADLDIRLSAL